jgi:pimeloyl-ACP methyl ester carboxylesterase
VRDVVETRYATVDGGGQVAYQAIGNGPIDVLVNRPPMFPVDMMWEEPRVVRFLDRLSSFCWHVWLDPRGTGASDWIAHEQGRLVESFVDDMVAVIDHLGCDRVAILGLGVPGVLFAATHPDRTRALVLADSSVRYRRAEGYPAGWSDNMIDERIQAVRNGGLIGSPQVMAPSRSEDVASQRWFNRAGRLSCSPGDRVWRAESALNADLRAALSAIRVPTLVITHRDRPGARQSHYIAAHIDGAKRLDLPGADCLPFAADSPASFDTVEEFLTGRLPPVQLDRVLATILFTDIVNSTGQAASLGDRRWRELLDRHDAVVEREVERFRGRKVKSTGDGVLATFDGPGRAVRCAVRSATRSTHSALTSEPACTAAKSNSTTMTCPASPYTSVNGWPHTPARTKCLFHELSPTSSPAQISSFATRVNTNSRRFRNGAPFPGSPPRPITPIRNSGSTDSHGVQHDPCCDPRSLSARPIQSRQSDEC